MGGRSQTVQALPVSTEKLRSVLGKAAGFMFPAYHGWLPGKEWSGGSAEGKMEAGRLERMPLNANEQVEMVA